MSARAASDGAPDGSATRLVAGVDEAGLGPLLGPLAVGWSTLRVPAHEKDVWKLLAPTVGKRPNRRSRLFVADSKKLFHQDEAGLRRLESTSLAFLALLDPVRRPPARAEEVMFRTLQPAPRELERHPWYARLPELPRTLEPGSLELSIAVLERRASARGVALVDAGVRIVPEGELNASFERTRNKAASTWMRTREVLRHLWKSHAREGIDVIVDMLGGRTRYATLLEKAFPPARVRVVEERPQRSAYEVEEAGPDGARRMGVDFRVRGEDASFPVALASCLAKYSRELAMAAFNEYFAGYDRALRPTAGYRNDAWRWLRDANSALDAAGVDRALLVRQR